MLSQVQYQGLALQRHVVNSIPGGGHSTAKGRITPTSTWRQPCHLPNGVLLTQPGRAPHVLAAAALEDSGPSSSGSSSSSGARSAVLPSRPWREEVVKSARSRDFRNEIEKHEGTRDLLRTVVSTLQVNIGLKCNQACSHCHVESSPLRTESIDRKLAERLVLLLEQSPSVRVLDLTGGAPELNEHFRYLVVAARKLGVEVIDRCNLTVLQEPGQEALGAFLAEHQVHVVASLPCYSAKNVDMQRGVGVFDRSIKALRDLNALGYGKPGTGLVLDLVYNPLGASLPGPQVALEAAYKAELQETFGIVFNSLLTITNMPIKRFADQLHRSEQLEPYMDLLQDSFNPRALQSLMCRNLVSVGWDGRLFDCDFNQQLEMPIPGKAMSAVWDVESLDALVGKPIACASHCYGCTAGQGSSCGGAIA